ncbi:unnamed protein product [Cuscuta campestris]|uniref:RRM domain-containing protein n=1 Tax=Cuscuta campestris TaxID=132261 RepID=A0A484KES6_9ASTE|nr:unnamed protein product [Cuscuta campestris]
MSEEDFKVFHGIDRKLFSRLVIGLGRDPAESMQLMGFLLWLEEHARWNGGGGGGGACNLVDEVLGMSPEMVNAAADEAVMCLKCIEEDHFPLFAAPNFARRLNCLASPLYLLLNRAHVLRGVNKYVSDVCFRAFDDILLLHFSSQTSNVDLISHSEQTRSTCMFDRNTEMVAKKEVEKKGNGVVHPDERTIFLTFSKGYPISQEEVADFFSKKFGDSIESIQMQEVPAGEQVLYAKLVARSLPALEAIVVGGKAKYNINGKHVWARKYVKKQSSNNNKNSSSPPPPLP